MFAIISFTSPANKILRKGDIGVEW